MPANKLPKQQIIVLLADFDLNGKSKSRKDKSKLRNRIFGRSQPQQGIIVEGKNAKHSIKICHGINLPKRITLLRMSTKSLNVETVENRYDEWYSLPDLISTWLKLSKIPVPNLTCYLIICLRQNYRTSGHWLGPGYWV